MRARKYEQADVFQRFGHGVGGYGGIRMSVSGREQLLVYTGSASSGHHPAATNQLSGGGAGGTSSHLTTSMSLLYTTLLLCLLLALLPITLTQFDKPKNANKFVDSVSQSHSPLLSV